MIASKKPRFIRLGACLIGVVAVVAITVWFFRSPIPRIDAAQAAELCAAADHLSEGKKDNVQKSEWPEAISKLSPKSVRVTNEGVYVVRRSFFVTEAGIFLLPTNSSFQPTLQGDPSYRQLRERIYWYDVKG